MNKTSRSSLGFDPCLSTIDITTSSGYHILCSLFIALWLMGSIRISFLHDDSWLGQLGTFWIRFWLSLLFEDFDDAYAIIVVLRTWIVILLCSPLYLKFDSLV